MDALLHDFVRAPRWEHVATLTETYADSLSMACLTVAKVQSDFALQMLHSELSEIAAAQPEPQAPPPTPKAEERHRRRHQYKLPERDELPPDLQELWDQSKQWLQAQQHMRGQMRVVAYAKKRNPEALYDLARGIMITEANLQDAYERMDYYAAHGKYLPGTEPFEALSEVDQLKHYLQIQPRLISYLRKYGGSSDPKKQAEAAKRRDLLQKIKDIAHG